MTTPAPFPNWSYRFIHLTRSGAVFAYEECSHRVVFCRSFEGQARGTICIDAHTFEWFETWAEERDSKRVRFHETVLVNGTPISRRFALLVTEFIVGRLSMRPKRD